MVIGDWDFSNGSSSRSCVKCRLGHITGRQIEPKSLLYKLARYVTFKLKSQKREFRNPKWISLTRDLPKEFL